MNIQVTFAMLTREAVSSLVRGDVFCPRDISVMTLLVFSFILIEIHNPGKACRAGFIPILQMRKQTQRSEVMCLFNKCPNRNWNQRLLTSVSQHSVITAPPG